MHQGAYKQILSLKAVHLIMSYITVYAEVTIGGKPTYKYKIQCVVLNKMTGWIVTYLIHQRGGGSSIRIRFVWFLWGPVTPEASPCTRYPVSHTGLTLGRVVRLWVNRKVGKKKNCVRLRNPSNRVGPLSARSLPAAHFKRW